MSMIIAIQMADVERIERNWLDVVV